MITTILFLFLSCTASLYGSLATPENSTTLFSTLVFVASVEYKRTLNNRNNSEISNDDSYETETDSEETQIQKKKIIPFTDLKAAMSTLWQQLQNNETQICPLCTKEDKTTPKNLATKNTIIQHIKQKHMVPDKCPFTNCFAFKRHTSFNCLYAHLSRSHPHTFTIDE